MAFNLNSIDRLIGQPFFYADYEVGIGWESIIEEMVRCWESDEMRLYLSCGTIVNISHKDIMLNKYRAFRTNLKEENEQKD